MDFASLSDLVALRLGFLHVRVAVSCCTLQQRNYKPYSKKARTFKSKAEGWRYIYISMHT